MHALYQCLCSLIQGNQGVYESMHELLCMHVYRHAAVSQHHVQRSGMLAASKYYHCGRVTHQRGQLLGVIKGQYCPDALI
jgi:hypothetical protein